MKKKKISKVVWFDETEMRLPIIYRNRTYCKSVNSDEIYIECSFKKPKRNAKRIRITVEEI